MAAKNQRQEGIKKDKVSGDRRLSNVLNYMQEGYAFCEVFFNENILQDFTFIEVNPAFEKITGLKNIAGKKVTQVIKGIKETDPEIFTIFGNTGNLNISVKPSINGFPFRFTACRKNSLIFLSRI